jgi:hypothetical protein
VRRLAGTVQALDHDSTIIRKSRQNCE